MSATEETVAQQLLDAASDALNRKQPREASDILHAYCQLRGGPSLSSSLALLRSSQTKKTG